MALSIEGDGWTFAYRDPRIGMIEEGVTSGTVLFRGQVDGGDVAGTAYRFSRRCGAIPYDVEGELQADGKVVLQGRAPIRLDRACNPVRHEDGSLVFEPLSSETRGSTVASASYRSYRVIGVTDDDVLNIRSEPTSDSDVIGEIPPAARGILTTGACQGEWCPVEYRGVSGWANSRYLAAEDASTPERGAPTKPPGTVILSRAKADICQTMVKEVAGAAPKERASAIGKSLTAQCERCFTDGLKKEFSSDELSALDAIYDKSRQLPASDVLGRADAKYSALFSTCADRMIETAGR